MQGTVGQQLHMSQSHPPSVSTGGKLTWGTRGTTGRQTSLDWSAWFGPREKGQPLVRLNTRVGKEPKSEAEEEGSEMHQDIHSPTRQSPGPDYLPGFQE